MIRIFFVLIINFCSILAFPQTDKEQRDSSFNDSKYNQLMSKIDKESNSADFVNDVWYVWTNRDGAIGIEISPYIAKCILNNTELIFKKFLDDPKSYRNWVEEIPFDLFTDYSGTRYDELKKMKTDLIDHLNLDYKKASLKIYQKLIKELLDNILNAEIRKID